MGDRNRPLRASDDQHSFREHPSSSKRYAVAPVSRSRIAFERSSAVDGVGRTVRVGRWWGNPESLRVAKKVFIPVTRLHVVVVHVVLYRHFQCVHMSVDVMQCKHGCWSDPLNTKPSRHLLSNVLVLAVAAFLLSQHKFWFSSCNISASHSKHTQNNYTLSKQDHIFTSLHTLDYSSCVNDTIVPKEWCLDSESIPRYVGREEWPPRAIRHYSHAGYEQCLANKTIVFIGDSRVRYQFMHLAAFLKTKQRMKCEDYRTVSTDTVLSSPECYLIEHEQRNSMSSSNDWNSWYKRSTEMINSNLSNANANESSHQTTICDCYRSVPFRTKSTYENRFLTRSTQYGLIKLIYLQNFENTIRMNEDYPPFSTFAGTPERCKAGECGEQNRTDFFSGSLNDTIWSMLPLLNATHAFVSMGWEHVFGFEDQSELSCTIKSFEKIHKNTKLFLLSHPPAFLEGAPHPLISFDATKIKCDCDLLDLSVLSRAVPREWYVDALHVLSILNEEYNHQLIEKLCPK